MMAPPCSGVYVQAFLAMTWLVGVDGVGLATPRADRVRVVEVAPRGSGREALGAPADAEARGFFANEVVRISKHSPGVKGLFAVYVLSPASAEGDKRFAEVSTTLAELGVASAVRVYWLTKAEAPTESEQMNQTGLPMTPKQQHEWKTRKNKETGDGAWSGALACALGHYHIVDMANAALNVNGSSSGAEWVLVLEDDARLADWVRSEPLGALQDVLESVPESDAIVFLDDRHCEGAEGRSLGRGLGKNDKISSQAYAFTRGAAKPLLRQALNRHSDFWLNGPISDGSVTAYCPPKPVFSHAHKHTSMIGMAWGLPA